MGDRSSPRVIEVERVGGNVLIMFDDGRCAIFSAALLDSVFSQAEKVPERENKREISD